MNEKQVEYIVLSAVWIICSAIILITADTPWGLREFGIIGLLTILGVSAITSLVDRND